MYTNYMAFAFVDKNNMLYVDDGINLFVSLILCGEAIGQWNFLHRETLMLSMLDAKESSIMLCSGGWPVYRSYMVSEIQSFAPGLLFTTPV